MARKPLCVVCGLPWEFTVFWNLHSSNLLSSYGTCRDHVNLRMIAPLDTIVNLREGLRQQRNL